MKNKIGNIKNTMPTQQVAVLLEDINGKFDLLADGQKLLKEKLDATMGRVATHVEDITMINIRVSGIKDDTHKINGKLATMETDISALKSDVGTLKSDVGTLKSDVSTLKSDVATIKTNFGERINRLEVLK